MNKETPATLNDVVLQLKTNNLLLAAFIKASNTMEDDKLFKLLAQSGLPAEDIATVTEKATHTIENKLSELRHKAAPKTSAHPHGDKEAKK